MSEGLITALIAAAVSAIVSLGIAYAQLHQARVSQSIQAQQDITDKYNLMVDYRLKRPDVLKLARLWNDQCYDLIYSQNKPDGSDWAIYYGYVELVTLYCSAVLYAKNKHLIPDDLFRAQHEPLIRLLLAEHYPIFSQIIKQDGYVSEYLVDHVRSLRDTGWDWSAAHKVLVEA